MKKKKRKESIQPNITTEKSAIFLAQAGMIAAIYVALTVIFAPTSGWISVLVFYHNYLKMNLNGSMRW